MMMDECCCFCANVLECDLIICLCFDVCKALCFYDFNKFPDVHFAHLMAIKFGCPTLLLALIVLNFHSKFTSFQIFLLIFHQKIFFLLLLLGLGSYIWTDIAGYSFIVGTNDKFTVFVVFLHII